MNEIVKMSIDARENAIYTSYPNLDQKNKDKVLELFKRINELGNSCKDATEFETKFATSSLNEEYTKLFTDIASTNQIANLTSGEEKEETSWLKKQIKEEIEYQVDSVTQPTRAKVRQEVMDKARETPVLGDAMYAKQIFDFLGKFKKKN